SDGACADSLAARLRTRPWTQPFGAALSEKATRQESQGGSRRTQMLPTVLGAVKRLVLSFVCLAAFLVAAPAYAKSGPNPFGITIVRFSSGTTPAQMQAAVVSAGGSVVTDLSPVGALAVAPVARDFRGRIAANARVIDAFREPLFDAPLGRDSSDGGGSSVGPLAFGRATTSSPDPWHDASSFLGVTNPQGILQWDDARMNVPSAWATTLGDKSVKVAVLDTGVQKSHRELKDNVSGKAEPFVPCEALKHAFGEKALK